MSAGINFAIGMTHLLRIFAVIAGATAVVGLLVLNRDRRPRGLRRLSRARRPDVAAAGATAHTSTTELSGNPRPPGHRTIGPAVESRALGEADLLAELHGVGGLAARARGSRWRKVAREVAASHLQGLAAPDHVVELDLELGGQTVAATLLTTTGIYVVVIHDRDANDAGGLEALTQLVRHHARALSALARLTGIEPELIVYSPYIDAPAQPAYIAERIVTTVGRPASLTAMLDRHHGAGLTIEALDHFRDAAKPRGRGSRDRLAPEAIGLDSPDLGAIGSV
jgi:hypothetical protein